MSDNDLIRRGQVLERLELAEHDAEERDWRSGANEIARLRKYVAAIPAVQPTVSPDVAALVDAAEKVINSYWHSTDGVITGIYDLEAALVRVKGETK